MENYLYTIKNSLDDEKLKDKFSDDDKGKIEEVTKSAMEWLDSNTTAEKDEYEAKQKEVQEACMPIMAKLHQEAGGGMPEGMPGMPGGGMPNMNNQDGPTVEDVD